MSGNSQNGLISVENVTKKFGTFSALDDISLKIGEGENFGYIGPNGAGKTTTIKIIVGLISDFSGRVNIDDFNMPGDRDKVHRIIGYLPQNVSFQDWRTVEHTLRTFGKLSEMDSEAIDNRVEEVLERIGLQKYRNKKMSELSGGTVQKVGLAQAIIHNPKLLILDEPLSGLDPASRYEVKQIVKELGEGGTAVFFSSHILSDVQDVADRIGIISEGQIVEMGTLNELKSRLISSEKITVEFFETPENLEMLQELKGIEKIEEPSKGRIIVHVKSEIDIEEMSQKILNALMGADSRIRRFAPVQPDLDEIYLNHVKGDEE